MTAASISALLSSTRSSNEKLAAPSDAPVPRLSYQVTRLVSAIVRTYGHRTSIVKVAAAVRTTSSPSPNVRYALNTPLLSRTSKAAAICAENTRVAVHDRKIRAAGFSRPRATSRYVRFPLARTGPCRNRAAMNDVREHDLSHARR